MRRTGTILIADDDQNDVEIISHVLQAAGVKNPVRCFHDGDSLMRFLEEDGAHAKDSSHMPLLVFLDWNMPRSNSAEVIKWIRRQPEYLNLLIIVLTGSANPKEKKSAYEAGANWHFVKSADFPHQVQLVRRVRELWAHTVEVETSG